MELEKLLQFVEDNKVLDAIGAIKQQKKHELITYIYITRWYQLLSIGDVIIFHHNQLHILFDTFILIDQLLIIKIVQ